MTVNRLEHTKYSKLRNATTHKKYENKHISVLTRSVPSVLSELAMIGEFIMLMKYSVALLVRIGLYPRYYHNLNNDSFSNNIIDE